MNTKFDKAQLIKESQTEPNGKTYVVDDFFDTMSCEALERAGATQDGAKGRGRYSEQRKLDLGK